MNQTIGTWGGLDPYYFIISGISPAQRVVPWPLTVQSKLRKVCQIIKYFQFIILFLAAQGWKGSTLTLLCTTQALPPKSKTITPCWTLEILAREQVFAQLGLLSISQPIFVTKNILRTDVNFTNILRVAFTLIDTKSIKKQLSHQYLFTLSRSALVKTVHIMLMKLSPDSYTIRIEYLSYQFFLEWKWR